MLTIRNQQMAVFEAFAGELFLKKMEQHLRVFFPEQCDSMTSDEIRRTCEHGCARAAFHGITSERDVCKYINLMFTFGREFDVDLRWPWATRILRDAAVSGPTLRINRLYIESMQYAREGRGLNSTETQPHA